MIKLAKTCFIAALAAGATLATMAEEPKLDAKSAKIVQRMKAMRLPKMEFAPPKTIIDAIEFFRVASKKYDSTEIPEEKRGFNFVLRTDGAEWSAPTIPMIEASDISFYDALTLVCQSIDYTFEVLPGQVVRVMSKKNYEEAMEYEKKAKIEKSAGKSGKESEVSRKNKSMQAFKSYRFCVDSTKIPTDCMQLSEFELYDADGKAIPSKKFKFGFTEGDDDDFGDGETPECAVDGKLDTKWLDFRAEQNADAERRSAVWIQFNFAEPRRLAGYRWYTANDDEDRDPRSWRLLGSNDGVKWIVVDKVEDFEATSERKALAYSVRFGSVELVKTSTLEGWLDDYDAALKKAAAENKYVLIDFTGSDWCRCCKILHKEVFATDEFRKGAAEKYVLLMVDNPADKSLLAPEAAKNNSKLAKKFGIRNYPTVVVLDSKGEEVTRTIGYQGGGPEKYLKMLDEEIRFAPEVKKYIKPIEDVLHRHDEDMKKDCNAILETKVNEKFPKDPSMMSESEWQKYFQDKVEYAEKIYLAELFPKYEPLVEKCIAEAKEMKVPEVLEERKKAVIEELEKRFYDVRNKFKKLEEENSGKKCKEEMQ